MTEEIKNPNIVINGPLMPSPPSNVTSTLKIKEAPGFNVKLDEGTDIVAILSFVITAVIVLTSTWLTIKFYQKTIQSQKEIAKDSLDLEKVKTRVEIVSKNRQDWINSLRDTLAEFIAASLSMVELVKLSKSTHSDAKAAGVTGINNHLVEINFKLQQERTSCARLMSKIALLSNPTEPDFIQLLNAVNELRNAADKSKESVDTEVNQLISISQKILKNEWNRVKNAE